MIATVTVSGSVVFWLGLNILVVLVAIGHYKWECRRIRARVHRQPGQVIELGRKRSALERRRRAS